MGALQRRRGQWTMRPGSGILATDMRLFAESRFNRQRGLALLSVLWVLVLLSVMAASFTRTSRTNVRLARNYHDSAYAKP